MRSARLCGGVPLSSARSVTSFGGIHQKLRNFAPTLLLSSLAGSLGDPEPPSRKSSCKHVTPLKMVGDISALRLRHVSYGIPTELFGHFVSACLEMLRTHTKVDSVIDADARSHDPERILARNEQLKHFVCA